MKLPSWLRLPRLPLEPARLVAMAADGNLQGYRLRLRWDGRYELQAAALPPNQPCVLVVDRSLPYRRKLQRLPDTPASRLALLRTAPDEFPLPAADMLYGLGVQGHDGYLYALPKQTLADLQQRDLRPAIVLVAGAATDAGGCLETLEGYLRHGAAMDLLRAGRFLSRRGLRHIQLGAALVLALLAAGGLLARPDLLGDTMEWRAAALRKQGGALPKLYRVTEKMAYAQGEAARLYASPESRLTPLLAKLFATVPAGHSLRGIEFKNGVLKINGTGTKVQDWLVELGFPADQISVENMGSYQRFTAERPI